MFTITCEAEIIKILFTEAGVNLSISFTKAPFDPQQFVAFKGLLHSRPIKEYQAELILDQEGLISLVYQTGEIHFRMARGDSILILPINREAYNHLDYLLNQWL